ncbi:MAG: sigma-70 family RNA polymerase sigma factor, partial [Pseudomonadales bacterium]
RNQELKDPDCLTSYVYSTARFTFLGWRRKKDNQIELTETIDQFECPQSMIERTIMDDELANYLHNEIENLSVDRDRDILQRHYLQEQSKREICDALLLDVDLYDKVICRARQRLKASINPENNALIGLFA